MNKMSQMKIIGKLMAIAPIAHNGDEKSGNTVTLRRINMVTSDGTRKQIPYVEGNAVRGLLRRILIADFCERLKIKDLDPRVYHMLFTGGNLEAVSKGQGEIDITLRKKITQYILPISMLGTSYLNQAIPGKLIVAKLYPVCKELSHFFENYEYKNELQHLFNVEQLTDETFQTRLDDRSVSTIDAKNPIQMKVETEIFIPGTPFMHYFILSDFSKEEKSMFHHLMNLWKQKSIVGGKSAIGNGQLLLDYDLLDLPDSTLYLKFLQENREKILEVIQTLVDEGINRTKKKKKLTKKKEK